MPADHILKVLTPIYKIGGNITTENLDSSTILDSAATSIGQIDQLIGTKRSPCLRCLCDVSCFRVYDRVWSVGK